jgi:uncharacterized protein
MAQPTDTFDLGRLSLASGEGRGIDLRIRTEGFEFGGQRYDVEHGAVVGTLDAARTTGSGYSLRLRFAARLQGPCVRCLESADQTVSVDAREIDQPGSGEELRSPYLEGDDLDVKGWARDALALALPVRIVCSEECLGLCTVCGQNLNRAGLEHEHEREPDPRWAKLSEVRFE